MGVSLWYEEIEEVDTLVLNPEWISHGIYTIINWVHEEGKHGLSLTQFKEVFKEQVKRYPSKEHEFLFKLMKHYQLAFEVQKGKSRQLVIPHLLKEDQPALKLIPHFEVGESLMIQYKSQIDLPPHTISRFIVRHHEEIKHDNNKPLVWREGVVLDDGTGSLALVIEDDRTLTVSVKGESKTAFLDRLRNTLNELFKEFKSQKPKLEYRVKRYGELPRDLDERAPLWLPDQRVLYLASTGRAHPDHVSGQDIKLNNTVNIYHIHKGNLIEGNVGNLVGRDQNNFHFENCTIGLQGDLNALSSLLTTNGYEQEGKEISEISQAVEAAEDCQTPKEVKKKGLPKKLKLLIDEMADDKSNLHKAVKAVKNGVKLSKDIVSGYNTMCQWLDTV